MSQCLEKYKNNFAIKFAKVMQKNLPRWKKFQKEHIKALFSDKTMLSMYLFFFFISSISALVVQNSFLSYIGVILIIFLLILNINSENKEYQNCIKTDLFSELLKVFDQDIEYGAGGNFYNSLGPVYCSGYIPNSIYNNSMLFNKSVSYDSPDDTFTGVYNDCPFTILETKVINTIRHIGGKLEDVQLFKGIAMHFKMKKKIKSRVLIYSKGLLKNKTPEGFEKVKFEYEKFNKKYNVYVQKTQIEAGGQIEARYLFNTAFMDRFMQLQTSFRINKLKCSIFGDSMLVLLATNKDLFEMNHLLCRIDDIHQYKHLFDEFASILSLLEVLNLSSKKGL